MSVINRMLQDLERRHAGSQGAPILPGQLHAMPAARRSRLGWMVATVLAVLLCAALGWIGWQQVQASRQVESIAPPPPAPANPIATTAAVPVEASPVPEPVRPMPPAEPEVRQGSMEKVAPVVAAVPAETPKSSEDESRVVVPVAPKLVANRTADIQPMPEKQVNAWTPEQKAENDYRRATSLVDQGRLAEAMALLEQALQEYPLHGGARQALIALLVQRQRIDEAMQRATDGLALDAKQPGLAMILARLQVDKGQQQAAISTMRRSQPYASDRPDYAAFLAALLQREGRHKEAIEQYLQAVRITPQNGVWWMGLGISLQADNRQEEAGEAFLNARQSGTLSADLQAFVEQRMAQLQNK